MGMTLGTTAWGLLLNKTAFEEAGISSQVKTGHGKILKR